MNFIFRDFGIIRVKTLTMFGGSKSVAMHTNAIKEIVQRDSSDERTRKTKNWMRFRGKWKKWEMTRSSTR